MIKLNNIIYNKLQLQIEEAKDQGLFSLAEAVTEAIGDESREKQITYSSEQINEDIHKDLWKIAAKIIMYHDLNGVNIEGIDQTLISWADKILNDLETTLNVSNKVGPLEPKLPGETSFVTEAFGLDTEEIICVICGHFKENHCMDDESCTELVENGYRIAPTKCECPGFVSNNKLSI